MGKVLDEKLFDKVKVLLRSYDETPASADIKKINVLAQQLESLINTYSTIDTIPDNFTDYSGLALILKKEVNLLSENDQSLLDDALEILEFNPSSNEIKKYLSDILKRLKDDSRATDLITEVYTLFYPHDSENRISFQKGGDSNTLILRLIGINNTLRRAGIKLEDIGIDLPYESLDSKYSILSKTERMVIVLNRVISQVDQDVKTLIHGQLIGYLDEFFIYKRQKSSLGVSNIDSIQPLAVFEQDSESNIANSTTETSLDLIISTDVTSNYYNRETIEFDFDPIKKTIKEWVPGISEEALSKLKHLLGSYGRLRLINLSGESNTTVNIAILAQMVVKSLDPEFRIKVGNNNSNFLRAISFPTEIIDCYEISENLSNVRSRFYEQRLRQMSDLFKGEDAYLKFTINPNISPFSPNVKMFLFVRAFVHGVTDLNAKWIAESIQFRSKESDQLSSTFENARSAIGVALKLQTDLRSNMESPSSFDSFADSPVKVDDIGHLVALGELAMTDLSAAAENMDLSQNQLESTIDETEKGDPSDQVSNLAVLHLNERIRNLLVDLKNKKLYIPLFTSLLTHNYTNETKLEKFLTKFIIGESNYINGINLQTTIEELCRRAKELQIPAHYNSLLQITSILNNRFGHEIKLINDILGTRSVNAAFWVWLVNRILVFNNKDKDISQSILGIYLENNRLKLKVIDSKFSLSSNESEISFPDLKVGDTVSHRISTDTNVEEKRQSLVEVLKDDGADTAQAGNTFISEVEIIIDGTLSNEVSPQVDIGAQAQIQQLQLQSKPIRPDLTIKLISLTDSIHTIAKALIPAIEGVDFEPYSMLYKNHTRGHLAFISLIIGQKFERKFQYITQDLLEANNGRALLNALMDSLGSLSQANNLDLAKELLFLIYSDKSITQTKYSRNDEPFTLRKNKLYDILGRYDLKDQHITITDSVVTLYFVIIAYFAYCWIHKKSPSFDIIKNKINEPVEVLKTEKSFEVILFELIEEYQAVNFRRLLVNNFSKQWRKKQDTQLTNFQAYLLSEKFVNETHDTYNTLFPKFLTLFTSKYGEIDGFIFAHAQCQLLNQNMVSHLNEIGLKDIKGLPNIRELSGTFKSLNQVDRENIDKLFAQVLVKQIIRLLKNEMNDLRLDFVGELTACEKMESFNFTDELAIVWDELLESLSTNPTLKIFLKSDVLSRNVPVLESLLNDKTLTREIEIKPILVNVASTEIAPNSNLSNEINLNAKTWDQLHNTFDSLLDEIESPKDRAMALLLISNFTETNEQEVSSSIYASIRVFFNKLNNLIGSSFPQVVYKNTNFSIFDRALLNQKYLRRLILKETEIVDFMRMVAGLAESRLALIKIGIDSKSLKNLKQSYNRLFPNSFSIDSYQNELDSLEKGDESKISELFSVIGVSGVSNVDQLLSTAHNIETILHRRQIKPLAKDWTTRGCIPDQTTYSMKFTKDKGRVLFQFLQPGDYAIAGKITRPTMWIVYIGSSPPTHN